MKSLTIVAALLCGMLLTSTASATSPFLQGVRAFRAGRATAILNQQAVRVQHVQRVQVVQKVQAVQVQPAYVQQFVAPVYAAPVVQYQQ